MWPWITWDTVIIFGGLAAFAYFGEQAIAALALIAREREEEER